MEYDVFISCKSEDYTYAEDIYKFLKDNGFHVFLASMELRKIGDSEYRNVITQALKSAYHLIVFASKEDYVDSTWVFYEWDWFLVAKIKGKKSGQLLTILKDVNIDDVNADLWKYESKSFYDYKNSLLSYVETPEHKKRKEEEKRKILEAEKSKIEKLKSLANEKVCEYERYSSIIGSLEQEIIEIYQQIGIIDKKCPICNNLVPIDDTYCKKCGWTFVPAFKSDTKKSKQQLLIQRGIYNEVSGKSKEKNKREIEHGILQQQMLKTQENYEEDRFINDISKVVFKCCQHNGPRSFSNKLSQIDFPAHRCRGEIIKHYGIDLKYYEIISCETIGDLISLIATNIILERDAAKAPNEKERGPVLSLFKSTKSKSTSDIFNIILACCTTYNRSVFLSDKLSQMNFQASKCLIELRKQGININYLEIINCKTYGELKSLIATKVGISL